MKLVALLILALAIVSQVQAAELVRITSISVYDNGGSSASPSVDVQRDICDDSDENEIILEPFSDVLLSVDVKNLSQRAVFVGSMKYKTKDRGDGRSITTRALSAVSPVEIAPGETKTVQFLFIYALNNKKYFYGSQVAIPTTLGFKNLEVSINLRDSVNSRRTIKKKTALSFGNFDNC